MWFQQRGWVGLLAWMIVATGSVVRGAEPRLALVSSELTEQTAAASALAEIELTRRDDVVVLERKAVDAVVREQRLVAGGFATTEDAVRIGQLLTADVFVHIEGVLEQETAAAVVVFDAVTGVRLEDSVAVGSDAPSLAKALVARVDAALQKRRLPAGKVVAISVLSTRTVGPADPASQSLGALLERRLLGAPAIVVVERKRLEHVNKERALPASTPTAALLSAPVLIELDVTRGADGKALRVAAFLADPAGADRGTIRIEGPDVAAAAGALVTPILQAVHTAGNLDEQHPDLEALRFFKVCRFWKAHGRTDLALEAAEAAYALNPSSPLLETTLVNALFSASGNLTGTSRFSAVMSPAGVLVHPQPDDLSSAGRLTALRNVARGMALLVQPSHPGMTIPPSQQREHILLTSDNASFFRGFGKQVAAARAHAAFSPEEAAVYGEFCRDWRNSSPFANKQTAPSAWDLLLFITEQYVHYFPDPAAAWDTFSASLRRWVDQRIDTDMAHLKQPLLQAVVTAGDQSMQTGPVDYPARARLWDWMEAHDRASIRLYGRCGRIVDAARQSKDDPNDPATKQAQEFLQEACRVLQQSTLNAELREACYQTALLVVQRHGWYARFPDQPLRDLQPIFQTMLDVADVRGEVLEQLKNAIGMMPKSKTDGVLGTILASAEFRLAQPQVLVEPNRRTLQEFVEWGQAKLGLTKKPANQPTPFVNARRLNPLTVDGRFIGYSQPLTEAGSVYALALVSSPNRLLLQHWAPGSVTATKLGLAAVAQCTTESSSDHLIVGDVVDACLSGQRYIAAVRNHGVFLFDRKSDGVEILNSQSGLPLAHPLCTAVLDQQLYIGTDDGCLVRCSLTNRAETALLACSSRREVLSPFDNGDPVRIPFVCADAPRGRILFLASVQTGEGWAGMSMTDLCGLWEYRPATAKFRQILSFKYRSGDVRWGKRVAADQLVFVLQSFNRIVLRYNLQTDTGEFLSVTPATLGLGAHDLRSHVAFAQNSEGVSTQDRPLPGAPPFLLRGDWLWTAAPWGRSSLKTFQFQELPPLSVTAQANAFSPQLAIQAVGPHQLLLATLNELWLVDLKDSE